MNHESAGPRAILQVRWGPLAFRKAILAPGQTLRVGSDEAMDLALPHDALLARAHFELAWDGSKCRISDLKTNTGTLLDGSPIKQGVVPHGGWIRAGGTDFIAYIERHTPPDASEDESALHQDRGSPSQALSLLSGKEGLYAVLDAARSPRSLTLLQESVEEHRSLYEGPQGAALADVAPYLVRLPGNSSLLEALVQEGWGKHWGVYITSTASFVETRRHLRKFLMVETEGEESRFYFRFYDPRVLHVFLPTCNADQRREFFGPIACFFYEDPEKDQVASASLSSPGAT